MVVKLPLYEGYQGVIDVRVDDRFISLTYATGNSVTRPIHDFLGEAMSDLGFHSDIKYIGLTRNPETRPLFDGHQPLSQISYKTDLEDRDIFIYFNIFKVSTFVENEERKATIITTNGLTNDLDIEREGRILEKSFILYFSPDENAANTAREQAEIKNSLLEAASTASLKKLTVSYEVENPTAYYDFATNKIPPKHNHSFICSVESGELKIKECASLF